MQKSKIEWTDYTWNPITGCNNTCPYCYARKMAENSYYKKVFPYKFTPHFYPKRLNEIAKAPKGSKVFVCSMGELFGDNSEWTKQILDTIKLYPEIIFQLLTKRPENLMRFTPFSNNVWVGMTVDTMSRYGDITEAFSTISARVKFVSFEPMLDYTPPDLRYVDWIIIGCQTKPTKYPPEFWIKGIIKEADNLRIPVFIKEPLASYMNIHRQEFPKGV